MILSYHWLGALGAATIMLGMIGLATSDTGKLTAERLLLLKNGALIPLVRKATTANSDQSDDQARAIRLSLMTESTKKIEDPAHNLATTDLKASLYSDPITFTPSSLDVHAASENTPHTLSSSENTRILTYRGQPVQFTSSLEKRANSEKQTGATNVALEETASKAACLLYTSPSPRDLSTSRMPSSA